MRIYLTGMALIGTLMAGCSSDWDPARTGAADLAAREREPSPSGPTAALDAREAATGFAALPDRGELLSYDRKHGVRRSGAYTSHPVEISEAHALNAIAAGGLRLSTPGGKPVNVAFDRIEEYADGNWSWFGQSENGDHAVLTFGESAVFGEFSSDGKSYRVTTRRGSAFVVETDPALAANNRGHHGDGPAFLIPPLVGDSGVGAAGAKVMAAAESGVAPKAGAFIDLALGYTPGMVTTYGNQATAITRLTSLVALGNAAYQRSGVSMRLRLVHVLQVNFPDNTENADALRKLTGYNETTGQRFPPDAALNALRAAREEYGADLVALVRQHRSPEQKGCGIAWLIGANQRQIIAADEEFGYSVVSDGSDLDEVDNNTYYCSEYSLVHELGHSMGQAHNQENSQYGGAHVYSYGYREASASGFHTIMAYPLANSSQTEAPYFATPLISFAAGRPYGVANTQDNVRSLNQTMPIIANFRATVVPVLGQPRNDVDGDGKSDLLFHSQSTNQISYRIMDGLGVVRSYITGVGPGYWIAATGDFNGNGFLDVVWTSAANDLYMWRGNGTTFESSFFGTYPTGWKVVGAGDVDGDGKSDLLFHSQATNQFSYRIMNGLAVVRSYVTGVGPGYTVAATGDFDGDGFVDIVWTSAANDLYMWRGNGNTFASAPFGAYPAGWKVVGAGDVNADGKSDLLFHNQSTSQFSYRIMDGLGVVRSYLTGVGPGYSVAAVGDYNRDGYVDIVWTSAANDLYMWRGNGTTYTSAPFGTYPGGWSVIQ